MRSPGSRPLAISTRAALRRPISTGTRVAFPSAPMRHTNEPPWSTRIAASGTTTAFGRSASCTSRFANRPGCSLRPGFGTHAFKVRRRVVASSVGDTKNTSPAKRISGNGFTVTVTGMPVRTKGTPISGTANTSCRRSTASTFTSGVLRRTLLELDLAQLGLRARDLELRLRAVELDARRDFLRRQETDAPEDLLGELRARRGLAGMRALLGVTQAEEHVALLHGLALDELDRLDHAVDLGAQLDRVLGLELADQNDRVANRLGLDGDHLDHGRRRREAALRATLAAREAECGQGNGHPGECRPAQHPLMLTEVGAHLR